MKKKKQQQQSDANPAEPLEQTEAKAQENVQVQDEAQTEDSAAKSPADVVDETAALLDERDRLQNQLQRTLADLANFRKRRAQEMQDARKQGLELIVKELLPVLDNFHLALQATQTSGADATQALTQGITMVQGLLEDVLSRHGVKEVPANGQKFDPSFHDALGIDPTSNEEEGMVAQVVQRGYSIGSKVIRPTKVMVAGKLQQGAGQQDPEQGKTDSPEAG